MKRWEVRQALGLKISDAALRKELQALNLSMEDGHSFTDEELQKIKNHFAQSQQTRQQQSQPPSNYSQNAAAALQIQGQASENLRSSTAQSLQNVQGFIEITTQQRQQTLEQISDQIAYLLCPQAFTAEALQMAWHKLQKPGKLQFEVWQLPDSDWLDMQSPLLPSQDGA